MYRKEQQEFSYGDILEMSNHLYSEGIEAFRHLLETEPVIMCKSDLRGWSLAHEAVTFGPPEFREELLKHKEFHDMATKNGLTVYQASQKYAKTASAPVVQSMPLAHNLQREF